MTCSIFSLRHNPFIFPLHSRTRSSCFAGVSFSRLPRLSRLRANKMLSRENKNPSASEVTVNVDVGDNGGVDEKRGNAQDRADMYRMGKMQEMKVYIALNPSLTSDD